MTAAGVLDLSERGLEEVPVAAIGAAAAAAAAAVSTEGAAPTEGGSILELLLFGNRLTCVPGPWLGVPTGPLARLTVLALDHNCLTAVPPEIGALSALEHLSLHDNRLTALPPTIGSLRRLMSLRLDRNALTELPEEVGDCCSLNTLHLDGNALVRLPRSLGRLPHLADLGLGSNPHLTSLPPELADASALMLVWAFEDTAAAVTNVPPDLLLAGDADALRAHLALQRDAAAGHTGSDAHHAISDDA